MDVQQSLDREKEKLRKKKDWLSSIRSAFPDIFDNRLRSNVPSASLFHYTSLPVLFSILENDAFWGSPTRFSNDSSEERIFSQKQLESFDANMDDFMFCLSERGDCLSQWRGYCHDGGASIELDLKMPREFSVLHADYSDSKRYQCLRNAPLPVLYVPQEQELVDTIWKKMQERKKDTPLEQYNIIPYFKDRAFEEEAEWRILFENTHNELTPCIRFRSLKNGVKVPYVVIMCGDIGKRYSQCDFDINRYSIEELDKVWEEGRDIEIPMGSDQEKIYYQMEERIHQYNKKNTRGGRNLSLMCEGHLPVKKIMVAPTYNRERIQEEIQRFCASIYWLHNVQVECSRIPYIPTSE